MRYIPVLLILSTFFLTECKADPVDGVDYQSQSVATVDRPLSGIINPAALGFWTSMGLEYAHGFTDSTYGGDDGFLLASQGAFFSLEWLHHDDGIFRRKYSLALGDRVIPNFYAGLSFAWFGGGSPVYKGRKDWKLGFLYHPRPFASLALVIDRINEPSFGGIRQERLYRPGLGLRPFGNKITFSADAFIEEGRDISKTVGQYRIALGPFRGVSFVTDYRSNGQWRFNLNFSVQQTRLGGQIKYLDEDHYRGGTYFIEVGAEEYRSGLSRTPLPGSMKLTGNIVEEPRGRSLFAPSKQSFYSVIDDLRRGADDPRIGSVIVKIEDVHLDLANAQELRSALAEYKANGKAVIVYMEQAGNLEYYLASVADRIFMSPTGLLEIKGLAITTRFYTGTMDKLGIKAQIVRTGPYKTFGDAFVDTALTEAARQQIDWLLDDIYAQFVDTIASGRNIPAEEVRELIDNGPYTSQDAYGVGLVDSLLYYDELTENGGPFAAHLDLTRLYSIPYYNPRWSEPKQIAIVYADGSIVEGQSGTSLLEGRTVGSSTLSKTLKTVRYNPDIKAVVFRVNSPGGDVFASEEIYRQLVLLRKEKPVIVSMGGVAASGGYYISCPGDEILALPGTITGSIGVVMGKVDLSGFYHKIGLKDVTIKRGRHADIRSADRAATPEEMALIDTMLWEYYGDFVDKVSTWREISPDSVNAIGEGRVWTGHQARDNGLINSYGGIYDAIALARRKANFMPKDKIEVVTYPVYRFSFLPLSGTPSLETQISTLLAKSGETEYYYKPSYEISIK
jgi:protease-4